MTKRKKGIRLIFITIAFILPLLLAAAVIFLKVDTSRANAVKIQGTVTNVTEGGLYDINFSIVEEERSFYINRGVEKGLSVYNLLNELKGKKINIWYAKTWLGNKSSGPIMQLQYQDSIYFSVWK